MAYIIICSAVISLIIHSASRQNYKTARRVNRLIDQCCHLIDALDAWEEEKPHLYHGACPYARTLIFQQIALFDEMKSCGYPEYYDTEYIDILYELLENLPPNLTPPLCGGFILKYIAGVIG
jgi:hypothetical protein